MHHFKLTDRIPLRSSDTVIEEYTHECGTKLIYLNNGSEEKALASAFKTIPSDSTGVFHILEHSVLSGSENYPVASPILYMLKNSMQTYLNALTFQGKTMYPCASCNEKDFENLMRVYLDAVFKPTLSHDTFMREGWHLEKQGDVYAVSGVVFNEMNGAMSSPEQIVFEASLATTYPDTYQAVNSGGDPKNVPDLTYEKYLETYREYYSAKNCVLILSGKQDLEHTFSVIEEYLATASMVDKKHEYTRQAPVIAEKEYFYPVTAEKDLEKNTYIVYSYNLGDFGDEQRFYEAYVLYNLLLSENTCALKSALLKSGLLSDVEVFLSDEYQRSINVVAVKTDKDKKEEIRAVIEKTLKELIEKGIDKKTLKATIAEFSFNMREDLSQLPAHAVRSFFTVADNVFYHLPLNAFLECDEFIEKLEALAETDHFEKRIREIFLENDHHSVTIVSPEVRDPAKDRLALYASVVDKMTEEEKERYVKEFEEYAARQGGGDDASAVEKMPKLKKEEIPDSIAYLQPEESENVLFTKAETNGIVYMRDYFTLKGFTEKEISAANFLATALGSLATKNYTAEDLTDERKLIFGRVGFHVLVTATSLQKADAFFTVTSAFLEKNKEEAVALLKEMLVDSVYAEDKLAELYAQEVAGAKIRFLQNGMNVAIDRASAVFSTAAKLRLYTSGHEYLKFLDEYEGNMQGFASFLQATAEKLFTKARLTVGVTGKKEYALLVPTLPEGETAVEYECQPITSSVAYGVPSTVNYNVKAMDYTSVLPYSGKHLVMSKLLTLGYLWHNVREKGNAYGTSLRLSREGVLVATSYRDPSVKETYEVYNGIASFLENTPVSEEEILGCVISVAGDMTKPTTVESESIKNEIYALCGVNGEDIQKTMKEALSFTKEDVSAYAKMFKDFAASSIVCTVGAAAAEKESGLFDEIVEI